MSWYSEDQMDDVIDAIEKKLGGEYKIDYTYVTNSDYNNVLSTQLAAGRTRYYCGWSKFSGKN